MSAISIGIAASVGADTGARVAAAVERAGFHALWVNDTPGADALAVLRAAADATSRLVLATGVLPVDRRAPADVAREIARLALPHDRLVLGIGAGQLRQGALERVQDAAALLRDRLSARVVVGALGPRMRRLGAAGADGVLLSWLTPDVARAQAAEAHADAVGAHVALYVRSALDERARAALETETARYAGFPAYRANYDRLGIAPAATVIAPGEGAGASLAAYRAAVDEVVLRAITTDDRPETLERFVADAAALRDA